MREILVAFALLFATQARPGWQTGVHVVAVFPIEACPENADCRTAENEIVLALRQAHMNVIGSQRVQAAAFKLGGEPSTVDRQQLLKNLAEEVRVQSIEAVAVAKVVFSKVEPPAPGRIGSSEARVHLEIRSVGGDLLVLGEEGAGGFDLGGAVGHSVKAIMAKAAK